MPAPVIQEDSWQSVLPENGAGSHSWEREVPVPSIPVRTLFMVRRQSTAELVERLVRWGIHPEDLITDEFPLEQAGEAYRLMASGNCGKVAVVFPED